MSGRVMRLLLGLPLLLIVSGSSCHKPVSNTPASPSGVQASLVGTDWLLTDLVGTPVIANSKASIAFMDGGRAAGNGSCNRFTGAFSVSGDTIKLGPFAATRMACMDGGVSAQEDRYLKLLEAARRFEIRNDLLLIYVEGFEKPLKYSRQTAAKP